MTQAFGMQVGHGDKSNAALRTAGNRGERQLR
jgi:hypothetical protein